MPLTAPPLISVIMPCFNGESFIACAVESVLEQTYPNIELIVVDDGSTDRSLSVLAEYGDRICVIEQHNAGPYPARNKGVQASKGEYLAFLDADDYWSYDCLKELYNALSRDSEAALAYCGWQNVGLEKGEPYVPPDYEKKDKLYWFLQGGSPWPIHAVLLRRSVYEQVGGFRCSLPSSMDYDLWLRIGLRHKVLHVDKVMAFYRHHKTTQITADLARQAKTSWLVKKRIVRENSDLMANIPKTALRELVDGRLLKKGYEAYWRRELSAARQIFRLALFTRGWKARDLKFLAPTLLPEFLYIRLICWVDARRKHAS